MTDAIDVFVEVAPSVERFADPDGEGARGFRDRLSGYAKDLVADFGLGADVTLNVRKWGTEDPSAGPYRLLVNDRRARLGPSALIFDEFDAERLARRIGRDLFENRELLLTPPVFERLRLGWESRGEPAGIIGGPPRAFGTLLALLIRRCVRVDAPESGGSEDGARPGALAAIAPDGAGADTLAGAAPDGVERLAEAVAARRSSLGLKVHVSQELADSLSTPRRWTSIVPIKDVGAVDLPGALQYVFYKEVGLVPPMLAIEPERTLGPDEFRIQINDARLPVERGLGPDDVLVSASTERLAELGVSGTKAVDPPIEGETAIVRIDNAAAKALSTADVDVWGPLGFVGLAVAREVRARPGALLGSEIVGYQLQALASVQPVLARIASERLGVDVITALLRLLLDEGVSIRDLPGILEATIAVGGATDVDQSEFTVVSPRRGALRHVIEGEEGPSLASTADCVRRACRRLVSSRYTSAGGTLQSIRVDQPVEARVARLEVDPLTEDEHEGLLRAARDAYAVGTTRTALPVVVTNGQTRRRLRALIEKELPLLPVLSYQEVLPGVKLKTVGRILLAEGGETVAEG